MARTVQQGPGSAQKQGWFDQVLGNFDNIVDGIGEIGAGGGDAISGIAHRATDVGNRAASTASSILEYGPLFIGGILVLVILNIGNIGQAVEAAGRGVGAARR